jgi:hypothetical protein
MVAEVNKYRAIVQQRLDEATKGRNYRLTVGAERLVDGWIQFAIEPDKPVNGEEYVQILCKIEQDLEQENTDLHLLLLPALVDD